MMRVLDTNKPDIAGAVLTIAPAVPSVMVDSIAVHLALFPLEARQLAAVRLAEALQAAAEDHGEERDKVAGITLVALDMAMRRLAEASL